MYDPETYEKYKSAAARDAAEFTPRLVSEMTWSENETVLDYGCGAGSTGYNFILPTVEKHGSKLYSVDISEKMVEFAKKEYSHPCITYAEGNILENFPFDKQFDKIFSIYVLHFVKDFRGALKKFHEILKPGGTLGFTVVGQSRIFQALHDIGRRDKWKDIMAGYEKYVPEWVEKKLNVEQCFKEALLQQCGFEILTTELHNRTWKYASVDYLTEFYMSLNPYVRNLTEDQRKELKEDYKDMIINQWHAVGSDGQPIEGKYELLYVRARKQQ